MATEEHKSLANIIKSVHESLRKVSKEKGAEEAWKLHLKNQDKLKEYAYAMNKLANIWENNSANKKDVISRVKWIRDYIISYFFTEGILLDKRQKELRTLEIHNLDSKETFLEFPDKIKVLDVGSCFNPFKECDNFDVIAIDLCPANDQVIQADFLQIEIVDEHTDFEQPVRKISKLKAKSFHAVVFSLLLEYMPSSAQRIECCQKAFDLLHAEGILIIVTPDSQHVGKNARIMKNWRYTLALMGFQRIKFEKLSHITCMTFRKSINIEICRLWAEDHKEEFMDYRIDIPQDFNDDSTE